MGKRFRRPSAPGEYAGLVERLNEAAHSIEIDGAPSQVGLSAHECREVAAVITALAAEQPSVANLREAWDALRMIREAIEELGPVGCMASSEHVACAIAPTPTAEAEEIVSGIKTIATERDALAAERDDLIAQNKRLREALEP